MPFRNGLAPEYMLFGTAACHLCEEAEQLVTVAGINFQLAEIMEQPEWLEKYSLSIPVLRHSETGRELAWPFDNEQLQVFLRG